MLNSFPFMLAVGSILGFLSGIGVGGGSLLILWLTAIQNLPPEIARNINLLFFLPAALISSFFRWKQGCVKPKELSPAVVAGCISAALFSWIGTWIHTDILKRLFGILLIITGTRELFHKDKKAS